MQHAVRVVRLQSFLCTGQRQAPLLQLRRGRAHQALCQSLRRLGVPLAAVAQRQAEPARQVVQPLRLQLQRLCRLSQAQRQRVQLLRTRFAADGDVPEPRRSGWIYFRQACAVSLTNPKVILFFVAFFPLFLRADASGTTLVAMMLHVTVLSFLYQAGLVLVGNAVAARLKRLPFTRRLATQLAGIALIGFGFKLAASNR